MMKFLPKNLAKHATGIVLASCLASPVMAIAGFPSAKTQGPEVRLDPTALISDIKQSRAIADSLYGDIQDAIARLKASQAKLQRQGCEAEDRGGRCRVARNALRSAYNDLLDQTERQLPPLKRAVGKIQAKLKQKVMANGASFSAEAQERLIGSTTNGPRNAPRLLGVSGFRLSSHLAKLQNLVGGAASGKVSIDAIAADLYLDMQESSRLIDTIADAVATSKIRMALYPGEELAMLEDDEIQDIHAQVFGQSLDMETVPSPPVSQTETAYVSPLLL